MPSGAAARAGVRVGDLVDLRVLTPAQRFDWQYLPRRGEQVALHVIRRGAPKLLTLTATRNPIVWSVWLVIASELWMLLFAALMAWRRPGSPHARALTLSCTFSDSQINARRRSNSVNLSSLSSRLDHERSKSILRLPILAAATATAALSAVKSSQ